MQGLPIPAWTRVELGSWMPLSPKGFTVKINRLSVVSDRSAANLNQEQNPMPRVALRPMVLVAVLALMAVIVGAQAPAPQPEEQETARIVVELLERGHMARPVIDDEIAVKWCDNFLKDLDPAKQYFLKADVDEFKKEAKTLDDQVREGNIDFARKVLRSIPDPPGRAIQDPDGTAQGKTGLYRRRISHRRSR